MKKNKKLLGIETIIDDNAPLIGGTMRTTYDDLKATTTNAKGTTLTLKMLQDVADYFDSEEYLKLQEEKIRFRAMGEMIASRALYMGLINEEEFARLLYAININGGLIISQKMYDKILPAAKAIEKEMKGR